MGIAALRGGAEDVDERTPRDRFLDDVEAFGRALDGSPPPVPAGSGAAAWVLERVQQVMEAASDADVDLRVDAVVVQTAPEEMPQGLKAAWAWSQVPLTLETRPGGSPDPLPPGMCRLWVEVSRTPVRAGPGARKAPHDFADQWFVHGLVPNAEQEERLRRLPDLHRLWETVDPLPLDEALARLAPPA